MEVLKQVPKVPRILGRVPGNSLRTESRILRNSWETDLLPARLGEFSV
jgi:hypothetical protein